MATKTGFAYYNTDTDRYQDIRIKKLKKSFGCNGIAVYDYILCEIYRVVGYSLSWDESTVFDVAEYFGLKETTVTEIVNYCCHVGLFSKELLANESLLSSQSIQRRFIEMCKRAKRKDVIIPEECTIIPEEMPIVPEEMPIVPEVLDNSRVEKSRVEKSRVNKSLVVAGDNDRKLKAEYESLLKTFEGKERKDIWIELKEFVSTKKPEFIEPYMDIWNIFAITHKIIKEQQIVTDKRKNKFKTRISEKGFDFLKILEKISQSKFCKGDNQNGWKVSFEFIIDSEENYTKILEGKYN